MKHTSKIVVLVLLVTIFLAFGVSGLNARTTTDAHECLAKMQEWGISVRMTQRWECFVAVATHLFDNVAWKSDFRALGTRVAVLESAQGQPVTATATIMPTMTPAPTATPTAVLGGPQAVPERRDILRRGPGISHATVSKIEAGQQCAIIGKNDDGSWWNVSCGDVVGWIQAERVNSTGTQNVPVVPTPTPLVSPTPLPTNTPSPSVHIPIPPTTVPNGTVKEQALRYANDLFYEDLGKTGISINTEESKSTAQNKIHMYASYLEIIAGYCNLSIVEVVGVVKQNVIVAESTWGVGLVNHPDNIVGDPLLANGVIIESWYQYGQCPTE